LESCNKAEVAAENAEILEEIYDKVKDLYHRNLILRTLVWYDARDLKAFFLKAFKRERYLDMRLTAIRGYANYASEKEIDKLMAKFTEILIKRPESTPYNYQEYEMIRSVFGLPYLVKRFAYKSFINALEQTEKQYNDMPDAFKGIFTLNERGESVELISAEERNKSMEAFWQKHDEQYKK
jgi:DNA gyrase/topoisomerase IV subunit A